MGAIVSIQDDSHQAIPSSGQVLDGWMLCDGNTVPSGQDIDYGESLPNLNQNIFLRGCLASSNTKKGSNDITYSGSLSGSVSDSHSHDDDHFHYWGYTDAAGSSNTTPDSTNLRVRTGDTNSDRVHSSSALWIRNRSSRSFFAGFKDDGRLSKPSTDGNSSTLDYFSSTAGVTHGVNGGGSGANTNSKSFTLNFSNASFNGATVSGDNRPKHTRVIHLIKVRDD